MGWSLREGRTFLNAEPRFATGPVAAVWDKVRQSSLTSFRSRRGAKASVDGKSALRQAELREELQPDSLLRRLSEGVEEATKRRMRARERADIEEEE